MRDPIIVTGAAGAIGEAVTRKLMNEGFFVIAIDITHDILEEKYKGNNACSYMAFDLNKINELQSLIKQIKEEYGGIRGLVHCAGFDKLTPLYLYRQEDIEALFSIHVYVPMALCGLIAKKGNASNGCSIVLISSLSAHEGAAGHTGYAAAKGALEGFIPSAAAELADRGIRINAIAPGIVRTKMSAGYLDKLDQHQFAALEQSYPLGFGQPTDVANLIAFLISDEAKWITGQTIIIDGGHLCRKV